jgi:hypothetical protein
MMVNSSFKGKHLLFKKRPVYEILMWMLIWFVAIWGLVGTFQCFKEHTVFILSPENGFLVCNPTWTNRKIWRFWRNILSPTSVLKMQAESMWPVFATTWFYFALHKLLYKTLTTAAPKGKFSTKEIPKLCTGCASKNLLCILIGSWNSDICELRNEEEGNHYSLYDTVPAFAWMDSERPKLPRGKVLSQFTFSQPTSLKFHFNIFTFPSWPF